MTSKDVAFNSRSIIDQSREHFRKLHSADKVSFDNNVRLTRSFNLVKAAYASKNANQSLPSIELVLLWAAFNNLYSDRRKRRDSLELKHSEQRTIQDFVKQITSADKKIDSRKPKEGPPRQFPGSWVSRIMRHCHSDCVTVASCQWSYQLAAEDWDEESERLLKRLKKYEMHGHKNLTSGSGMLANMVIGIYYLRCLMVHGQFDPGNEFLHSEMLSAANIMRATLALTFQVMLESLSRDWGWPLFGEMDQVNMDVEFVPKLD